MPVKRGGTGFAPSFEKSVGMIRNITMKTVAIFLGITYLAFFQLFLESSVYLWLGAGNILFFCMVMGYSFLSNHNTHGKMSFAGLFKTGITLSLSAAMLALAGSLLLAVTNFYFFRDNQNNTIGFFAQHSANAFPALKKLVVLLISNTLLVNLISGGLASFFAAGIINERNYAYGRGPLTTVDPVPRTHTYTTVVTKQKNTVQQNSWLNEPVMLNAEQLVNA